MNSWYEVNMYYCVLPPEQFLSISSKFMLQKKKSLNFLTEHEKTRNVQ